MPDNNVVTSAKWAWTITEGERQQSLDMLSELEKAPAKEQEAIFESDASWVFDEE